jgi:hypothetical protein
MDNMTYEITLAKETACLMLKNGSELIDYTFINQMEFADMTTKELMIEAEKLAAKNNITEGSINLN